MERGYESDRLNTAVLQTYLEEDHAILAVEVTAPAYLEHLWVNQLQPIAFTYAGDKITAPLQLAASAGAISGKLTVDIAAKHRAIPENYLHVHLNQARLNWISLYGLSFFRRGPSNYDEILAEAVTEAGYHAFSTEHAVERVARTDPVESNIDLESLRNPEDLDAFMRDLWSKGITPRNHLGRPKVPLDLKFLQLLRQHIPMPDAFLEELERSHIYAEEHFYSLPISFAFSCPICTETSTKTSGSIFLGLSMIG